MRILWHSDWIGARTGYGKQTRQVVTRLQAAGHEVLVSAAFAVHSGTAEIDGVLHLPGRVNAKDTGQIALPMHVGALRPDVTVTLIDVWALPPNLGDQIARLGSRWVPWVPVDHDPCPAQVVERLRTRPANASTGTPRAVAMSAFGQQRLAAQGIDAALIPHGVELDIFKPAADKAAARRELGLPEDVFLVVMVQANQSYPSRKCFQQQLDGFARFNQRHADSLLNLHSWDSIELGGPRLSTLAAALGIRHAVIGQDPYEALVGVPDARLATIYQAADVTLNATGGEGFGVPIIESLACGTRVIVTDFSAMAELCPAGVGWRVPGPLRSVRSARWIAGDCGSRRDTRPAGKPWAGDPHARIEKGGAARLRWKWRLDME